MSRFSKHAQPQIEVAGLVEQVASVFFDEISFAETASTDRAVTNATIAKLERIKVTQAHERGHALIP